MASGFARSPSASPIAFQPSRTVADCDIGRIIATTPGVLSREWTPPAPGRVYVELRFRRLGCRRGNSSRREHLAEPVHDPGELADLDRDLSRHRRHELAVQRL